MKVTLPNGYVVEVADAKELAQVVRELGAMPSMPPVAKTAQAAKRPEREVAKPAPDHRSRADIRSEPAPTNGSKWTPRAARELESHISEATHEVFKLLVEAGAAWVDGATICSKLQVLPRGLGGVTVPITRAAHALHMPDPLERHSERVGRTRSSSWRLTVDFLDAYKAATAPEVPIQ